MILRDTNGTDSCPELDRRITEFLEESWMRKWDGVKWVWSKE